MKKILLMPLCVSALDCFKNSVESEKPVDVFLIGGGITSAASGTYLNELEPGWTIEMVECLGKVVEENSSGRNNVSTGHLAFYESSYTSEAADGSMDISKAVVINENFEIFKQFWAYQIDRKVLNNPKSFINNVSHMSFVWDDDNVAFLKKRHAAPQYSSLSCDMEYSEDPEQIKQWVPLVMEGREPGQKIAATRMSTDIDVNFGEITRQLVGSSSTKDTFKLRLQHEVRDFKHNDDDTWTVAVADLANGDKGTSVKARFVLIGVGSGALKLLQMSGIPGVEGYAGFPVGGSLLVTTNLDVAKCHLTKVYGKTSMGSPPTSVLYLDTRIIDGKPVLLFGPFATFSTKSLKSGSLRDLPGSVTSSNISPMSNASIDDFDLSQYLIDQLMLSQDDRMASLCEYFPEARDENWRLVQAGQRVQTIEKDAEKGGALQPGTEVVIVADGSVAALLGASLGTSTAAPIMLSVLEKAFKDKVVTPEWQVRLKEIVPSYGRKLNSDIELTNSTCVWSSEHLQLIHAPV